jgi:hypothetical protein
MDLEQRLVDLLAQLATLRDCSKRINRRSSAFWTIERVAQMASG